MEKYLPKITGKPLVEKIELNMPIERLFGYFADSSNVSFLNSSLETDAGRYSFIGINPFLVLRGKGHSLELRFNGHKHLFEGDPLKCLESAINTYKVENNTSLPFISGGIGYLSYDLKDVIEKLPRNSKDDLGLPDIYFVFYRTLFIHDKHDPKNLYISVINTDSTRDKNAEDIIKETINIVRSIPENTGSHFTTAQFDPKLTPDMSKENYIDSINKVLEYIHAGDIYQACLSQRFKAEWPFPSYDLYLKLNKINPAPFSSYLNFRDAIIISSSPELFLKLENNVIETRPMKGTRPRGSNPDEDQTLKNELLTSTKDDAELSMIVDLERNDLGKISVPGTVEVVEHRRIETYPTVFQAISIVKSLKEKDTTIADVIKATFPGGSITGCPKIRAMEIIDELEPTTRNVYTGAIGYISFHDTMELNMAIRTMLLKEKNVYFQVGGGIVADSDPEAEYEETLYKARALMEAIHCAPGHGSRVTSDR